MRCHALICLAVFTLIGCTASHNCQAQQDWPHWRGPDGTGAVPDADPPATFNYQTGENVKWTATLPGNSAATPIVVGDWVFTPAGSMESMRLYACGLDRATGEVRWKHDIAPARKSRAVARENHHAECSPVADDKHVYFIFGTGDLICYTHAGEKQWHINLTEKYGPIEILWGYGSSPVLLDGKLYVQVLRRKPDSFLLCVDAANGDVVWKQDRPTQAEGESLESYASPIAATIDGRKQLVVYGGDALTGHDAETGKELWRFTEDLNPKNNKMFRVISGPTQGLNGWIYVTSPRGEDLLAIEVKNNTPKLKWYAEGVDADVPCPVYANGHVYVLSGGKKRMFKFDAETGKEVWSDRLDTPNYLRCGPTVAGGRVYLLDGQGQVLILSAGDQYKQLAKTNIGGYPTRSTISVAGDELYIRTGDKLVCVGD